MKKNNGVTMISLIITIIIIIILAVVSYPVLSSYINDTFEMDANAELRNVENVVSYAKTQILDDNKFIPNEDYLITDTELDSLFTNVLSNEEISKIKSINASGDVSLGEKYYLMNQDRFDSEFGNSVNITGIRENRQYLVNYMDDTVLSVYSGKKITNTNEEDVTPVKEPVRGEADIVFSPNGDTAWATDHDVKTTLFLGAGTTVVSVKYTWSESIEAPTTYTNSASLTANGESFVTQTPGGKTGNDWYLWVQVVYHGDDASKSTTKVFQSGSFSIDNENPTGNLDVDEINK